MGGTFDMTSAQLSLVSTLTFGLVGTWGFVSGVSARCWVLRDRMRIRKDSFLYLWASCCFPCGGSEKGYRPYFENYTVDASILQLIFGLVAQDDLKDH